MEEEDPLLEHDDDDDGDTTTPFQPATSSTPRFPEEIPMTAFNREKEKVQTTAEKYFIEGNIERRRTWNSNSLKIEVANQTLMQKYPEYGKDGKFLTLQVSKTKSSW